MNTANDGKTSKINANRKENAIKKKAMAQNERRKKKKKTRASHIHENEWYYELIQLCDFHLSDS